MLSFTRRRSRDRQEECWLVYHGDVHVGTIAERRPSVGVIRMARYPPISDAPAAYGVVEEFLKTDVGNIAAG